jgi:hypothetical protein
VRRPGPLRERESLPTFTPETLTALTGLAAAPRERDAIFRDLPELSYRPLETARGRALMTEIETIIAERRFRIVGQASAQDVWERGWREVADRLAAAETVGIETLKPQYFRPGVPFRLLGHYVVPETAYFEYYAGIAIRRQLMGHFLPGSNDIVELGCGTGINLMLAADLFRDARLTGADWASATLEILDRLGRAMGRQIHRVLYNMLDQSGRADLPITRETDVLTVHALEQLGANAQPVVDWLVAQRPRRCLHIEPIVDFYDTTDPFDDVACRYHLARGYLLGLAPALTRAAQEGRISIIGQGRVKLGNEFHEAYSYIAWEPR